MIAIRVVSLADGRKHPNENQFIKSFDADAHGGRGIIEFTVHSKYAQKFNTPIDAFAFWSTQSTIKPFRPDGRPNKPLTAFNVVFEEI